MSHRIVFRGTSNKHQILKDGAAIWLAFRRGGYRRFTMRAGPTGKPVRQTNARHRLQFGGPHNGPLHREVRPDIGTPDAAPLADEARLEIRKPDALPKHSGRRISLGINMRVLRKKDDESIPSILGRRYGHRVWADRRRYLARHHRGMGWAPSSKLNSRRSTVH